MLTFADVTLFYPEQTAIALTQTALDQAKQQTDSQTYSSDNRREQAFYNRLCLDVLSPMLTDILELPTPATSRFEKDELPPLWEILNGSIVIAGAIRLAIIPSDADPLEELRVEREWLEIPDLAAHYYLAVQVNLTGSWLRVLGYAAHSQLHQPENYDAIDQTYSLPEEVLIDDLNALWITQQCFAAGQPDTKPIAPLLDTNVQAILAQLNQHRLYAPRRILDFEQWRAIAANPKWRQQLYEIRTQPAAQENPKPKVNLSQWAQQIFPADWQPITTLIPTLDALLLATAKGIPEARAKAITLGNHLIALMVSRETEVRRKPTIGIQLEAQVIRGELPLPEPFQLTVSFLDKAGKVAQLAENLPAGAKDIRLQLPRLLGAPGESFSVTLSLGDACATEDFVI